MNDNLNALENELKHYLMQFSNDKDFMSLGGFKSNGQNEIGTINLLEANPNVVANYVKSTGRISVSSLHPTAKEQQFITKMNSEVQAANSNAQQQIAAAQQKAQQDVQAAQRDKEQGIQAVKNEYKEADRTISQLRTQIDKDNKDITRLSAQVSDLNIRLQKAQSYKSKYDESQKRLVKLEDLVEKIRNNFSGLSGIFELLCISSVGTNNHGSRQGGGRKSEEHSHRFESFIKKIHPFMELFVMLILLCIISVTLPKSCEGSDSSKELLAVVERIEQLAKQLEVVQSGYVGNAVAANEMEVCGGLEEHQPSPSEIYPKARIDVAEINSNNPMKCGMSYTVSLQNVKDDLDGDWESDDFNICPNGKLTPKHAGECKISYVVNGAVFISRTINVAE